MKEKWSCHIEDAKLEQPSSTKEQQREVAGDELQRSGTKLPRSAFADSNSIYWQVAACMLGLPVCLPGELSTILSSIYNYVVDLLRTPYCPSARCVLFDNLSHIALFDICVVSLDISHTQYFNSLSALSNHTWSCCCSM